MRQTSETSGTKEYATVRVASGTVEGVNTGATHTSAEARQFDGLRHLAEALNKLAELGYEPLSGAISHGEVHPGGANYTLILSRTK